MAEEIKQEDNWGWGLPSALIFVAVILAIRGLYFIFKFFEIIDKPFDAVLYLFVFVFYLFSSVGIFYRKRFGLYIGALVLSLEIILGLLLLNYGSLILMLVSIALSLISLIILWENTDAFRKFDQTDKGAIIIFILLIASYFAGVIYTNYIMLRPEQYAAMVTQEAVEKGDWRVCERLDRGWRSDCIRGVAVYYKNATLCGIIESINRRDLCYHEISESLNS